MRRSILVLLALSLAAPVAAGDFVTNPARALPGPKVQAKPLPAGANANAYIQATDFNAVRDAVNDLRDAHRALRFENILDHGASTAASDNSAAIQAAVDAATAAGGGTVLVPSGTFRFVTGIKMKHNVTISGTGPASVLNYDPPNSGSICDRFGFAWEGTWVDYPTRRTMCDNHPLALIGMQAGAIGSSTITAATPGGFASIAPGDWILVAEGNAPKWNYKIQYSQVFAKSGDVLTLDRPLEFTFDGSGDGYSASAMPFGVERISPIRNAWIENMTVKSGQYAVFGAFGTGLAVRGGVRGVTFDPWVNPSTGSTSANPYANDVYLFEISGNTFLHGQFGGFDRSSHSRFVYNFMPNIGAADHEESEGSAFNQIAFNHFVNHNSDNPCLGIGLTFGIDVSHNHFVGMTNNSAIKVVGGVHGTIAFNTLRAVDSFPISIGTVAGWTDHIMTRDWKIVGNVVELKTSFDATYPAITIHQFPHVQEIVVSNNWTSHWIKVGYGDMRDDRRTMTIFGNTGPWVSSGVGELTRIPIGAGAITWSYATNVPSTGVNGPRGFDAGEIYYQTPPPASGSPGFQVVAGGTVAASPLSGVTASTTSGSTTVTVNSAAALLPGQYVSIAGVTGTKKITNIVGTTLTVDTSANATVSGAAVAWVAPTYRPLPGNAAAQANSTATDAAGIVSDFNALLAKLRAAGVLSP